MYKNRMHVKKKEKEYDSNFVTLDNVDEHVPYKDQNKVTPQQEPQNPPNVLKKY